MEIQEVTLGEISTITMGTSPKGETYNYEGVGMPLLNGPTEFGLIHPKCTLLTTDSKKDSKKGDLIFCVRGSTTGCMNWADMPYYLGRGFCSIRGATPMDTKYIKYYLDNKLDALLKLSGGATFPNLTGNDFATFPIHYQKNRHKIAAPATCCCRSSYQARWTWRISMCRCRITEEHENQNHWNRRQNKRQAL